LRFALPTIIQAEDWNYQEGLCSKKLRIPVVGIILVIPTRAILPIIAIAINETADFNLSVRVASTNSNGVLRFILIDDLNEEQDDMVIAELNIPNTGGWQSWTSISEYS
jgi:hypothetical protein